MYPSFREALADFSCQVYACLLHAYPQEFRNRFGQEMLLTFRDRSRDVLTKQGLLSWWAFLMHSTTDFAVSVLRERAANLRVVCLTVLAVGWSAYSVHVDAHATEVQAPLLIILLGSFFLSAMDPRRLFWWTFLVGAGIPSKYFASALLAHQTPDWRFFLAIFLFALLAAAAGAAMNYIGSSMRRL